MIERMDAGSAESLLTFAEHAGPGLRGLDGRTVVAQFEERYGDLVAAVEWFVDAGRTDDALRLASALDVFWMATKRLDEGAAWFDRVLAMPGGEDVNRGRALFQAGLLVFWTGDDDRSFARHDRALEIGRRIGDPTITAQALTGLARIALRTDVAEARRLCREAMAVTEGTDDRQGRSNATHVLGVTAQMAGDFLEARELMSERISLARDVGNYAAIGMESGNLSMVERQLGNLERADELAREALGIYDRRGDHWAMPYGISGIAAVATERGAFEVGATLIGAAESMMEREGAAWPPDERPHYERTVATLVKAMGLADFERARAAGRSMTSRGAVDFAFGAPHEEWPSASD
jgi:tetratricopeptide (TPR) repeat protein